MKKREDDVSDFGLLTMPACSPITVVTSLAGLLVSPALLRQFDLVRCPCDRIIGKEADGVVPRRTPTIYKTDAVIWKSILVAHEDDEV